jgi:hypothetical protein
VADGVSVKLGAFVIAVGEMDTVKEVDSVEVGSLEKAVPVTVKVTEGERVASGVYIKVDIGRYDKEGEPLDETVCASMEVAGDEEVDTVSDGNLENVA